MGLLNSLPTFPSKRVPFGIAFSVTLILSSSAALANGALSLEQAVELAQSKDPWLSSARFKQEASLKQSLGVNVLPNPKVSIEVANMPTDSWQFEQEPMTQIKLGIEQKIPRGESLTLESQKWQTKAEQFPVVANIRLAKTKLMVSELWLDTYLAAHNMQLIEQNRQLLTQLADFTKASYASGLKNIRQQDVTNAQLTLIQLEDDLVVQQQHYAKALSTLTTWLTSAEVFDGSISNYKITGDSAQLSTVYRYLKRALPNRSVSANNLVNMMLSHPEIKLLDLEQAVSEQDVLLQQQNHKPQWSVKASYGHRQDSPLNEPRADLFSVGVSFDMPLFTANAQDQKVMSAKAQTSAVQAEKELKLRELVGQLTTELKQFELYQSRLLLYKEQLLKQVSEQAELAVSAYTNDDGSFSQAINAKSNELQSNMQAAKIQVNKLKTLARINYFLTKSNNNQ
jgi:outer membrane protein TolC